MWDEQLLDAHFTLSMYKHLLNLPIDYKDVEAVDPDYYRNLCWMLTNSIENVVRILILTYIYIYIYIYNVRIYYVPRMWKQWIQTTIAISAGC